VLHIGSALWIRAFYNATARRFLSDKRMRQHFTCSLVSWENKGWNSFAETLNFTFGFSHCTPCRVACIVNKLILRTSYQALLSQQHSLLAALSQFLSNVSSRVRNISINALFRNSPGEPEKNRQVLGHDSNSLVATDTHFFRIHCMSIKSARLFVGWIPSFQLHILYGVWRSERLCGMKWS